MSQTRINEILAQLNTLSENPSVKTATMWVQPVNEHWGAELHLSDEELDASQELTDELYHLMNFMITFPVFAYKAPKT